MSPDPDFIDCKKHIGGEGKGEKHAILSLLFNIAEIRLYLKIDDKSIAFFFPKYTS